MKALSQFTRTHTLRLLGGSFLVLLVLLAPGCSTCGGPLATTPAYKPSNVYKIGSLMPVHIRRVAVLPISATAEDWQANESRLDLQPVLQGELGKTKSFEQVVVTPIQLKDWTGREAWLPEEKLPPNFFAKIAAQTGCEAVLFARLHPFHGFRPLLSGWELKLVDVHTGQIVWAVDEVFDASEPVIAQSALQWFRQHPQAGLDRNVEPDAVLASPRRFNAYALNTLFTTLPPR
ncbi:MAG: hypothetical protein JWM16_4172 [Verrucomicrobiales bacterium]|nr:hypothetical protein [Verrucomicrobiales bacterium]